MVYTSIFDFLLFDSLAGHDLDHSVVDITIHERRKKI